MKITELKPLMVEYMPEKKEPGILYISNKFNLAIHLCACGCGNEVVTPIGDNGWTTNASFEDKVTLRPSIGNWGLPCKSHYYITNNKIEWL